MMQTAHQPADAGDDPRNCLLDAFDAMVEAMVANGLESQLRSRLRRILPARAAGDLFDRPGKPAAMPATETTKPSFVTTPNDELEMVVLIGSLKAIEKIKMRGNAHEAAKRVRAWAENQVE